MIVWDISLVYLVLFSIKSFDGEACAAPTITTSTHFMRNSSNVEAKHLSVKSKRFMSAFCSCNSFKNKENHVILNKDVKTGSFKSLVPYLFLCLILILQTLIEEAKFLCFFIIMKTLIKNTHNGKTCNELDRSLIEKL